MRMTTLVLALAIATPAAAQVSNPRDVRDIPTENSLWAEQQRARQQTLAAERQAFAAQQRARAGASLQTLEARVAASAPLQPAPLDPGLSAQAEAIANAQARFLTESNARIRALTQGEQN